MGHALQHTAGGLGLEAQLELPSLAGVVEVLLQVEAAVAHLTQ